MPYGSGKDRLQRTEYLIVTKVFPYKLKKVFY